MRTFGYVTTTHAQDVGIARLLWTAVLASLLVPEMPSTAAAQQVPSASVETSAKAWFDYYRQRATNDYELSWSDEKRPLTLRKQEILNWTNPLEGGKINGSTFVWEYSGRPIVVGQLFSYLIGNDKRSFCHVFSALSNEPVVARRDGKVFWKPERDVETGWHVAADAPAPAATRPRRMIQMRHLARRFSAYTEEASRGKRNLRFLSQPLYRYDENNDEADGGIFAYVVGNDPELLILIECGLTQNDSAWQFRFSQSTKSTTVATLGGKQVYRYDNAAGDSSSRSAVYHSWHGVETIPSVLRENSGQESEPPNINLEQDSQAQTE